MTLTPEQNKRFEERFDYITNGESDEKFREISSEIKQHMAEEIERAVCAERERIATVLQSMEAQLEEELYGWDYYPSSNKQARSVIQLITKVITTKEPESNV